MNALLDIAMMIVGVGVFAWVLAHAITGLSFMLRKLPDKALDHVSDRADGWFVAFLCIIGVCAFAALFTPN